MTYTHGRQQSSADIRRAQTQYVLILSAVPATADQSLLGKALLDAGALNVAGEYRCRIQTDDWSAMEVHLKPTAVAGTFAPTLEALLWHEGTPGTPVAHPDTANYADAGVNFVANTYQGLALATLKGVTKVDLKFTVPGGGGSITFASATGIAEFHGL